MQYRPFNILVRSLLYDENIVFDPEAFFLWFRSGTEMERVRSKVDDIFTLMVINGNPYVLERKIDWFD